jgi:ribonuclease Z
LGYVIVGPRVRGKIDGKKLNELGVPFSPLRGKLANGETIQFEANGPGGPEMRTVRPEDCMSKSDPPAAVVILDIPSVEMIPSALRSFDEAYKPFRSSDKDNLERHTVRVVYHLLGPKVLEDERYIEFMRGFPETAQVNLALYHTTDFINWSIYSILFLRLNSARIPSRLQVMVSSNIAYLNLILKSFLYPSLTPDQ